MKLFVLLFCFWITNGTPSKQTASNEHPVILKSFIIIKPCAKHFFYITLFVYNYPKHERTICVKLLLHLQTKQAEMFHAGNTLLHSAAQMSTTFKSKFWESKKTTFIIYYRSFKVQITPEVGAVFLFHSSSLFLKLTRSALLLVCSILAVPLSVASPWQRNTLAGRPAAIKLLRRTRLPTCFVVRVEAKRGERTEWGGTEGGGKGKDGGWKSWRNQREGKWRENADGESKMNKEEGRGGVRDRERRDSQSMKLFDNLVIWFLKSISPEGPAIKRDTRWQRNKEAETLSGRRNAKTAHRHTLTHRNTRNRGGKATQSHDCKKNPGLINNQKIIYEF